MRGILLRIKKFEMSGKNSGEIEQDLSLATRYPADSSDLCRTDPKLNCPNFPDASRTRAYLRKIISLTWGCRVTKQYLLL